MNKYWIFSLFFAAVRQSGHYYLSSKDPIHVRAEFEAFAGTLFAFFQGASGNQTKKKKKNRLFAKGEESITYSPEQYAIVQKAVTVTEGLYFALVVSPDVDALKATVEAAVK